MKGIPLIGLHVKFTNTTNDMLKEEILSIHYMGYLPYSPSSNPMHGYHEALYEIIQEAIKNRIQRGLLSWTTMLFIILPKAFANNNQYEDLIVQFTISR